MLERASLIIKKLQQLVDDNANPEILLTISQMLVAELQQSQEGGAASSVSITMPRRTMVVAEAIQQKEPTETVAEPQQIVLETTVPTTVGEALVEDNLYNTNMEAEAPVSSHNAETSYTLEEENEVVAPIEAREEYILEMPEEKEEETEELAPHIHPFATTSNDMYFENATQIPTLPSFEESVTHINEAFASNESELNEKYKEHKVEVAHLLDNTHIKDLKRAISINEKYLFINELFGGDESMYDRSIKHIQSFSILPEATFWIRRELKIKYGWSENNEVVQLFDQLVKRRFS